MYFTKGAILEAENKLCIPSDAREDRCDDGAHTFPKNNDGSLDVVASFNIRLSNYSRDMQSQYSAAPSSVWLATQKSYADNATRFQKQVIEALHQENADKKQPRSGECNDEEWKQAFKDGASGCSVSRLGVGQRISCNLLAAAPA